MLLQKLIYMAPIRNCAFYLTEDDRIDELVKLCKQLDKTTYIDLALIEAQELTVAFNKSQIVIVDNIDRLVRTNSILYRLSCLLLEANEPYVFCIVKNKEKFNSIQRDKTGPLYLRWFWLDDANKLF